MTTSHPFPDIPGFRIEAVLGKGASATVYRATQVALGRLVALKVLDSEGPEGRRRALRLFREARTAGALDHPLIARGIDAGEAGPLCWFAMELVEGKTLEDVLKAERRLPWRRAVGLALDVLDALAHAHIRGVVHRDLKPSNLIVGPDGRTRVLDLGMARRESDPKMTHEGGTVGTPRYMAPEQALHPQAVDGRADLFSLGATLYAAVSGVPPFGGATVAETLTHLLYDSPRPLSDIVPHVPRAFIAVVTRALAKNPSDRFPEALMMAEALRGALEGKTILSPAGRRRRIAAVATTLAVVAGLVWWSPWNRPRVDPKPSIAPKSAPLAGPTSMQAVPDSRAAPESRADEAEPGDRAAILDDWVEETVVRLDGLVTNPQAPTWKAHDLTSRLDAITASLPDDAGVVRRRRVDTARRRAESALAESAIGSFTTALLQVRTLLGEGKLAEARAAERRLTSITDDERVPGAVARLGNLRESVREAAVGLAAVLDGLPSVLARGERPVDTARRGAIIAAIRSGIARAEAAGPLEETMSSRAIAVALLMRAEEAASMRDAWIQAVGNGVPPKSMMTLVSRKSGAPGALPTPRELIGRRGGLLVFRKTTDGLEETWSPEDLSAVNAEAGLALFGRTPDPVAVALLLHWDGDDLAARDRLKDAAVGVVREAVASLVEAGIAGATSNYRTAFEKEAMSSLLSARRLLDSGAYLAAAEAAAGLLTRPVLAGTSFLKEHRDEIVALATRARDLEARGSRLRPFGRAATHIDVATGRVRLEFDFKEGGARDGVVLPDGATTTATGLLWPGRWGDLALIPEEAPALRIPLPDPVRDAAVSVEVTFEMPPAEVAFPFFALRCGGYSALLIGELRDGAPFAGMSLHGLEKHLVAVRTVAKGAVAGISWKDLRSNVLQRGDPFVIPARGMPVTIRMDAGKDPALTRLRIGDAVLRASGLPVIGANPGIDLRLPPGTVLRSVVMDAPVLPPESK